MKTIVSYRAEFSASHTLAANTMGCGEKSHGHDFWVVVACENQPENWGVVPAMLWELHNRDLNAMLVGAVPTPEGIAAWMLERLRPHLPGLRSVTVGMRNIRAIVEV